jgi:hypothetical protein
METYLKADGVESKNGRKIGKASTRLFSKHLLKIQQNINASPIDLSFEHNSTHSNWRNNRNEQYHWLFNFNGSNKSAEVEEILSFWDHYDSNDREIFKPLLKSLIKLEKSVDIDRALTHRRVSEEMYVMF